MQSDFGAARIPLGRHLRTPSRDKQYYAELAAQIPKYVAVRQQTHGPRWRIFRSIRAWRNVALAVLFCVTLAMLLLFVAFAESSQNEATSSMDRPGHWGSPTSNANWCEADYVVTPYIAEFWNTLSSLVFVAVGLAASALHWGQVERRFQALFAAVAVVGVGSLLFHATLLHQTQMLDELPMLVTSALMLYIVTEVKMQAGYLNKWKAAVLSVVAGVTAVLMLAMPRQQTPFLVVFITTTVVVVRKSWQLRGIAPRTNALLLEVSFWVFFLATFAWASERIVCEHVRPYHLHALWHAGAGVGVYPWLLFAVQLRARHLGKSTSIHVGRFGLPYVRRGAEAPSLPLSMVHCRNVNQAPQTGAPS